MTLTLSDTFDLSTGRSYGHLSDKKTLFGGKYYYSHDTLFLLAKNNILKLKKENEEVYSVITPIYTPTDTLSTGYKFFAEMIAYPNRQVKEIGERNENTNATKEGVWAYYDSTGKLIKYQLFRDGVLIDNDFHEWGETKEDRLALLNTTTQTKPRFRS
jgi:hypothetical protein